MGNHALPGMDCPDLLLNVLEMWLALMFRCLPKQTLQVWGVDEGVFGALNIASPLSNGDKGNREWIDLSECDDPLVQEYADGGERKRSEISYEQKSHETVEQTAAYLNREKRSGEVVRGQKRRPKTEYEQDEVSTASVLIVVAMAVTVGLALWKSGPGSKR
ncbi:hypothetical protein CC80DRAFT_548468 [Byssothecium circinans]|uniref:Uncharacterized protein n=1 Tax=Byssothecium circinans TaxID=147558 RepID=A0A6A5TVW4_9PLEO|nr:hypothetical protein CC80DRAFT_548468 [Byssothecium circinans]